MKVILAISSYLTVSPRGSYNPVKIAVRNSLTEILKNYRIPQNISPGNKTQMSTKNVHCKKLSNSPWLWRANSSYSREQMRPFTAV